MPLALTLPLTQRSVVPLMSAGDVVVVELVTHRLPRLATVVGSLYQFPEPAAGLRRIQPIRVSGRSLQVVDLPAPEVGATDVPPFARCVRRQDERALPCTDQDPYPAHSFLLPRLRAVFAGVRCDQRARLAVDSAAGSRRGGRNVTAMATAPRPIPNEPMKDRKSTRLNSSHTVI